MTNAFRFAPVALLALSLFAQPRIVAQSRTNDAQPQGRSAPHNEDIFGHPLPAQHHVRVFGQNIAYYDMGKPATADQPVLVLLHGYGSQADVDFGPSLTALSKHRRIIALDQIGAGRSDKPFVAYHVQTYVEFLGEFLSALGIQRFDLLGESLGGWTAASYAVQSLVPRSTLPRPTRLILEDAAGFTAPAAPASMQPHMTVSTVSEVVTGLRAVFFDPTLITTEVAKRRLTSKLEANDGFAAATFSTNPAVRTEVVGDKAKTITLPTLVIWGAEDKTVPVVQGRAYAETIPGAKLVLIERSGHVPSLEQPEKFVEAVEMFLGR
jgi:pimeloyl-ACP methyl ester carboxylesterase